MTTNIERRRLIARSDGPRHMLAHRARATESCKTRTAEESTEGIDLTGETVVLTGCSSGIGRETLRVLVLRGAHVYGLAPTLEKARIACESASGPGIKGNAQAFWGSVE